MLFEENLYAAAAAPAAGAPASGPSDPGFYVYVVFALNTDFCFVLFHVYRTAEERAEETSGNAKDFETRG